PVINTQGAIAFNGGDFRHPNSSVNPDILIENYVGANCTRTNGILKKMTKINSSILIVGFFMLIVGFTAGNYTPNYATSEAFKVDGFYIFTDSKPVLPFDSLGKVDIGFVSGSQYESIRNHLINRSRKKFPTADGLILNLSKKGLDNCLVIKFK
ncbi:MAG: hypothetical protein ACO29U_10430, partial [Crocinitomicaceae bacterium]